MMVSRDGAFGILMGAAAGTLFLVPAHGSAQDSLAVSCADVYALSPLEYLLPCAEQAAVQYALGFKYDLGLGVPKDLTEAARWFRLAAAQGIEGARRGKDRIEQRITREQIAEAQRLSREWIEAHPQDGGN